MLSKYTPPEKSILKKNYEEKLSTPDRFKDCRDIFRPLLTISDELYIAALIWYKKTDETLINELLGITSKNTMSPSREIIYLRRLLVYIERTGFQTDPLTKANEFKDQILKTMVQSINHLQFIDSPVQKLEQFRQIPMKRLMAKAQESYFKKTIGYIGSLFSTTERDNESILIEVLHNLLHTSFKEKHPIYIEALISAISFFFMHRFEDETYTKLPKTAFYPHFTRLLGNGQTSQINPEMRILFCEILNDFFSSVTIKQWKKACDTKTKYEKMHEFFITKYENQLGNIVTKNNIPCSIRDATGALIKDASWIAFDVIKKAGIVAIAGKLYYVAGTKIIGNIATRVGSYLASCAGKIGEFVLKTPLTIAAEKAGEGLTIYGLKRGLDHAVDSVISGEVISAVPDVSIDVRLDRFEILIKLAFMHAKTSEMRECLEAIIETYSAFSEKNRLELNTDLDRWFASSFVRPVVSPHPVGETKMELLPDASTETKPTTPPPETPPLSIHQAMSSHQSLSLYHKSPPPSAPSKDVIDDNEELDDQDWVDVPTAKVKAKVTH